LNYEVRLPGYGGAGLFLRRTMAGDPLTRKAVDLWLLGPEFCEARFGRTTEPDFLPNLARYFFNAASGDIPEQRLPAFADTSVGITIDVAGSDAERLNLRVAVSDDPDADMLDPLILDFDVSRAALADTAYALAELAGGVDLADYERLR
jgi:hypothetical protein